MEVSIFIDNYREAFGPAPELPIAFWYSDVPLAQTEKIGGCFFKAMKDVRRGEPVSLNADTIGCLGGKFYTGFSEMSDFIPNFVSLKERYKQTPEMVLEFIESIRVSRTQARFLNFVRVDKLDTFDKVEAILFLATPDVLSGLTAWAFFDNNSHEAVTSTFGSGCSSVVTQPILENKEGGKRTFVGFFDPSVRPYFEANILSYTIPMSRFKEMYRTMRNSCLFDTHAWAKIRERINASVN
ncbi:uncharacterized protein (DUF169 family) [Dysgonomonas sp. PH5-45]|uniref:DUF169 domain-containing protein n=1 Tax=unclassified Dysgonomonas TaxID=2630389 RepID=UPI0024748E25|nr:MULTISPECIES: DUF169 domain-containing protein [unclassified Dysgonomonas]MDH6355230.1 uncharacterized protein (DUF169 family) [Dysgonomonas sp. PH5-45]MDH6388147.1 uncharacterized protein (DUF169 family) [Dysgonomonas sp. PH5-37]